MVLGRRGHARSSLPVKKKESAFPLFLLNFFSGTSSRILVKECSVFNLLQELPRWAKKKDRDEPLFVCSFFFSKAMRDLLFRTQTKLGSWVGSSVVHLGDKNVPNALMFLDKLRIFFMLWKKKKKL